MKEKAFSFSVLVRCQVKRRPISDNLFSYHDSCLYLCFEVDLYYCVRNLLNVLFYEAINDNQVEKQM